METNVLEQYVKDLRYNLTLVQIELVCLDVTNNRHTTLVNAKAKLITNLDSLYKQLPKSTKKNTKTEKPVKFTMCVN